MKTWHCFSRGIAALIPGLVLLACQSPEADDVDAIEFEEGALGPQPNTKVYVGGGDNLIGAFNGYLNDPNGWSYVRDNADGYYINNFALTSDVHDAAQRQRLEQMAALFTHKNVFYETDLERTTDLDDKVKIDLLRAGGFNVALTAVNRGVTASRIEALQWRGWRPVLAMGAPWTVGGDINSNRGAAWRTAINKTSGSATDGPMGYWRSDHNQIHSGSYSSVKYSHSQGKMAMVMLAPYMSGSGDAFLSLGRTEVLQHEAHGSAPDIWAIEYYAAQIERYPVTPESNRDGTAAGTVTGLAYWLLRHLRGGSALRFEPASSSLSASASRSDEASAEEDRAELSMVAGETLDIPIDVQHADEGWVEVSPVVRVLESKAASSWNIRYSVGDVDVTDQVRSTHGFAFVGDLRLAAGQSRVLHAHVTAPLSSTKPIAIRYNLMSHPWRMENAIQTKTLTLRVSGRRAQNVALAFPKR